MPEHLKEIALVILAPIAEQIENIETEYGISPREIAELTLLHTDSNWGRERTN